MNNKLRAGARMALAVLIVLTLPAASYAQLKVIASGGFSAAYKNLLPEFERTSGITVTTTSGASMGDGPNTIPNQVRRGVPTDIIILSRDGLADLIKEKRTVPGTDTDLARSLQGMIVRAGAPKPDISTVDAFKQTLLRAKGIATTSSTGGVYLSTVLIQKLGIADQVKGKISFAAAASVAKGENEIGIQQVSELLGVPGVDFVGTLPEGVQLVTTYSAAIVEGSKEIEKAKKLIAFLTSDVAAPAITKSGMEPAKR
jgi:molybdate transport system substrate-binding protein